MIIFKQLRFILPILVVALCGSALLSIRVGVVEISLKDAVGIILSQTPLIGSVSAESVFDETSLTIISRIRLPRLILTMLVGAALAMSGTVMQGFFQNPMADPYIVGVSSGAALGATTAMALGIELTFVGLSSVPVMGIFRGIMCDVPGVWAESERRKSDGFYSAFDRDRDRGFSICPNGVYYADER